MKGSGSESGQEIAGSEKSGGQGKSSGEGNEPTSESGAQPGEKPSGGSGGKEEASSKSGSPEGGKPGSSGSQPGSKSGSPSQESGGSPSGKSGSDGQSGSQAGQKSGGSSDSQGGESAGKPSGDQLGQGGRSSTGGGGTARSGSASGEPAKDETKPSPRAAEPESGSVSKDSVAPDNQAQTDLVLRTLQDVLKDPEAAKKLEQDTGLNREQLDQFVSQYKKVKSGPAGPGRDIEVKPGEQSDAKPASNLPGLDPRTTFSTKNVRNRGTQPQDDVRNNLEGVRFQVPSEWRGKYEGYRTKLAKKPAPKRADRPSAKPGQ
jgi:hypothetical protein